MEFAILNNNTKLPMVGFGVFQIDKDETYKKVKEAIEVGYRYFGTAQDYLMKKK